jgi:hypothetical protein
VPRLIISIVSKSKVKFYVASSQYLSLQIYYQEETS